MKKQELPKDPDLRGAVQALKRSAANALKLAKKTKTPCYVFRDGQIVDIAASRPKVTKKGTSDK